MLTVVTNHCLQTLPAPINMEWNGVLRRLILRGRQTSEKRTQPSLERQLSVQLEEQGQEVAIGVNGSFLDDLPQSVSQRKTLPQHQVHQDQGGRSTHSHDAVHQHFPCRAGCRMRDRTDVFDGTLWVSHSCTLPSLLFRAL